MGRDGTNLGGLDCVDAHWFKQARWRVYMSTTAFGGDACDCIGKDPRHNANGEIVTKTIDDLHSDSNNIKKRWGNGTPSADAMMLCNRPVQNAIAARPPLIKNVAVPRIPHFVRAGTPQAPISTSSTKLFGIGAPSSRLAHFIRRIAGFALWRAASAVLTA